MSQQKDYYILAYYNFVPVANAQEEVKRHKAFFKGRDVAGRIYISDQGINGQMSAHKDDALAYMDWLHADPRFAEMPFKIHFHHENVFAKMTVKVRQQLVALDAPADLSKGGEHVSPKRWKEMLEEKIDEEKSGNSSLQGKKTILIDTRNAYEWKIGRFQGAELPDFDTFREFPAYAQELKQRLDPSKTKVMMYCTGGIRCELYSALFKEQGFENVYQLEGGVINYGLQEGTALWEGKLFVFDDRLAIPISDEEGIVIGRCFHCEAPHDHYYNCANTDCNELFLCCPECLLTYKGCCQESCTHAPRVREHQPQDLHKPFRKWHLYRKPAAPSESLADKC